MISLDYTLFLQMVNFLALIFILNLLLYKPILGIIDKRKKQLQDTEEGIRQLQQSVEERMAAYEEKLRLAKLEALEKKNEIIKEGADVAKGFLETARSEIPAMMEQFHGELSREISEAKNILTNQSRKISVDIAEKLLGRSIQ
ncbi:MAG: ATP synthase F0 subunit B [Deltaproteobacteria bacterium]|nr:ATP synthase F0 subunit B [Deltaproteobacteria bacterium]